MATTLSLYRHMRMPAVLLRSEALALLAGVVYLLRRWGTRWGATDAEVHAELPGDAVVPHPMLETTHAMTIRASPADVWPWLVQMGYYRGGWYTERTWRQWWWEIGDAFVDRYMQRITRAETEQAGHPQPTIPSADHIIPELQQLAVGDIILDGPPGTAYFTVAALEPQRLLALHSTTHLRFLFPKAIRDHPRFGIGGAFSWTFILRETGESTTRLILQTRGNVEPWWYRAVVSAFLPVADLLLARKMLRGIKQRAEENRGKM